jgi:hypothetical protein
LAAAANPTVLEVLWAEPDYMDMGFNGGIGNLVIEQRSLFLSRRILKTYGGYALQQLEKARRGVGGSRGVEHFKREKFYLHTYRLMLAGIHALQTGDLMVQVEDPEALWAAARQPPEKIEREFLTLDQRITAAAASSPLPDEPDHEQINALLRAIRTRRA